MISVLYFHIRSPLLMKSHLISILLVTKMFQFTKYFIFLKFLIPKLIDKKKYIYFYKEI
jgi:hypothetical protein